MKPGKTNGGRVLMGDEVRHVTLSNEQYRRHLIGRRRLALKGGADALEALGKQVSVEAEKMKVAEQTGRRYRGEVSALWRAFHAATHAISIAHFMESLPEFMPRKEPPES